MKAVFKVFVLLVYCCINVQSSKILFIACMPAPSHQKPFQAIWRALAEKGHEVHALTPNPLNISTLNNLHEYDLSDFYNLLKNTNQEDFKYYTKKPEFHTAFIKDYYITKVWTRFYAAVLQHNETRRLINSNTNFDAVIVEWLYPTMGAFAPFFKAPLIGVTSLGAPLSSMDTVGNPWHPIISPDMNLPLPRGMSLKDRILTVLYSIYVRIHYHLLILPREDASIKAFLSKELPYIGNIEKEISVLLLNRNSILHRLMSLTPATIELGGIKFPKERQELGTELKKFLDDSKNGVVYFSLGSTVKGTFLPRKTVELFTSVFRNLPYNVLWKWENNTMDQKPDNVFLSKWIPQINVLDHPNVKLFITQGGLQSTEETIAAHKPIIGIPFHSDQTTNVDTCVQYGMGKMIELEDLTAEKLRSYILEIINNPSYAENAKKLDELMKDQPQDGLEKAIWWIEYVIRHKGAKHLRSTAVDLPWWKYLMLDIFAFISAIFLAIVLVLYYSFKFIVQLGSKLFRKNDNSTKKKSE
ncbi:UDP-glucuronosyltransferase 2B33-like [Sitophilus oryzae]|uniref:UDP-glucuronosyltransferase n=1 Tax=Sitophilus oryzae TaxID=7048 RepID=A0A6J2YLR6_SITOR|nr:UDP-glucuronosyltransferase 2B33-like [Sitophilus oryzae]